MPPIIVDLSQDSDEDCYVFTSKWAHTSSPQKPPLKPAIRTPAATRKARPPSSSLLSFTSPSKRLHQSQIPASFFVSPRIKQEQTTLKVVRRRLSPMPSTISFKKEDLVVDYIEAPMPEPFEFIEAPATDMDMDAFSHLMEMDPVPGSSAASPMMLPPSPPPANSVSGLDGKRGVPKRSRPPLTSTQTSPLVRPIKAMRKKTAQSTATARDSVPSIKNTDVKNGNMANEISRSATAGKRNAGVSARFKIVNKPAPATNKRVIATETSPTTLCVGEPVPQVDCHPVKPPQETRIKIPGPSSPSSQLLGFSLRSSVDYENTGSNELGVTTTGQGKQQDGPAKLVCRAHSDPDCNEIECVSDFFDTYSPFHETLPDSNEAPYVRERPIMAQRPPLAVTLPPPIAKVDIRFQKKQAINCLLASNFLDKDFRRPYMTLEMLKFLRGVKASSGEWDKLFKNFDGCLLHVGFSQRECELVGHAVYNYLQEHPTENNDFPAPCESGDMSEDLHSYLKTAFAGIAPAKVEKIYMQGLKLDMEALPGRTKKDCVDFLIDATYNLPDARRPFITVDLSNKGEPKPRPKGINRLLGELGLDPRFAHARTEALRARTNDITGDFQPTWHFNEGASDILDIQWSTDGSRFGMAAACYSDAYNRAGNLMFGTSDPWEVKMLYRHAFRVQQQRLMNLDKFLYTTVSYVRFSNDNRFLYSGGYDGFVKTWDGKTGKWISDIPLGNQVLTMATSPFQDRLVAAATKTGSIHLIRLDEVGKPVINHKLHMSIEDQEKQGLYASCLVFGNKSHQNWLIAGYDTNSEGKQHGGLAVFDVETEMVVFDFLKNKKRLYNTRHFDVVVHEEGRTFVTASLQRPHKARAPGIHSAVRVFDVRDIDHPILIKSPQRDINKVTISPCQGYVTASSTLGSTLVWDLRSQNTVMTELKHGVSKLPLGESTNLELDDTGVTFAQWGPQHDRFYTGSSDGIVKEWDITAGDPFIQDIARVDTQIMSAAFSPSWDELIIGECSGAATLFSTRGDKDIAPIKLPVDWAEHPDMISPNDDSMPLIDRSAEDTGDAPIAVEEPAVSGEEDSGVQIARQLVADGKMWIDGRWAWAIDDVEMEG